MAVIPSTPPSLTTQAATLVTAVNATLNGTLVDAGIKLVGGINYTAIVTERGFVYSTSPNPTVGGAGCTKLIVAGVSLGAYTYALAGLTAGTTYYFRSYGYNDSDYGGAGYGSVQSFVFNLPANTIQKHHIYQVYRQGIYQGLLPNVVSRFEYSQDINTAGTQIRIVCGVSPDTAPLDVEAITDESGVIITDEDGTTITTESSPTIIGNVDGALLRNGNQLKIYEISNYHPNGIIMFSGDIQKWEANFGGQSDQVALTAYSDGSELNNYLVTGGDTLEQNQSTQNANVDIWGNDYGGWKREGQSFTVGAGVTSLSAISIYTLGGATLILKIYNASMTTLLGSSSQIIPVYATPTEVKMILPILINVTAGSTYIFTVQTSAIYPSTTKLYYSTSNPYAGGTMIESFYGGGSGGGEYNPVTGSDLEFKTWSGGNDTVKTYSTYDPTNMLLDIILRYTGKGGIINVAAGSTDTTGLSITYTFKVATVFEAIQKALELAPYDWYWYVDIGTNTLYFKQMLTTAKYIFIKGKHINNVNFVASTENIKNTLYFTGGIPAGSTNLFSSYTDPISILNNKPRIDRRTDNRVTLQGTLNALGSSLINSLKDEAYQTSVTILDTTTDITKYKVGDTVGFSGTGIFIDSLILQIVRVDYNPESATLLLGQIPPRVNQVIKNINSRLDDLNTLANPSIPS